jgi:phage gpG-like protein
MFQINIDHKNIDRLADRLGRLDARLLEDMELVSRIASLLHARIVARTLEGRDADGRPFVPYSPGYAEWRRKHGRPVDRVDLFFRGHMMAAMQDKAESPVKAKIFFADAEQAKKAYFHHTGGAGGKKLPRRPFFALSDEDIELAVREVKDYVARRVGETFR